MTMPSVKSSELCGENRKASKPLIEKRRRARINYSLAELKEIIIGNNQPQTPTTRQPKLEKADILEMAVAHLKRLQEKQTSTTNNQQNEGYSEGFNHCFHRVCQFLENESDHELKSRLVFHLNNSPSNPLNSSESNNVGMDDTSSSCSSNSRSQTPASIAMETSQMEYFSSSPFTDTEQEVPTNVVCARTFPVNSRHLPCQSMETYYTARRNAGARLTQLPTCDPCVDTSSTAPNGPLNLARNAIVQKDDPQLPQFDRGNSSKSRIAYYNSNNETHKCMWRPWNSNNEPPF